MLPVNVSICSSEDSFNCPDFKARFKPCHAYGCSSSCSASSIKKPPLALCNVPGRMRVKSVVMVPF